jgi:hypothetical protein
MLRSVEQTPRIAPLLQPVVGARATPQTRVDTASAYSKTGTQHSGGHLAAVTAADTGAGVNRHRIVTRIVQPFQRQDGRPTAVQALIAGADATPTGHIHAPPLLDRLGAQQLLALLVQRHIPTRPR